MRSLGAQTVAVDLPVLTDGILCSLLGSGPRLPRSGLRPAACRAMMRVVDGTEQWMCMGRGIYKPTDRSDSVS